MVLILLYLCDPIQMSELIVVCTHWARHAWS